MKNMPTDEKSLGPAENILAEACETLRQLSPPLATALDTIKKPHIRFREGGFAGLFRIIIEQQVSVPSAQAILARCHARLPSIDPECILSQSPAELRACGLSGPKIKYVMALADAIDANRLDLADLATMSDEEASRSLMAIKGVGPWTAAIYLLFCEARMDIWPHGDVALLAAYAAASNFSQKPPMKEFDLAAQEFAPWRGIAAHILWTYYAKLRGRDPI
ncbi:MAG: DNA-3-methyladenine glycosylase family protein [bacterium]